MKIMPEIKICGITREEEAVWLGEAGVEYAGFVLYEKSRRYISLAEVRKIFNKLNQNIRKVAVVVSPDVEMIRKIEAAGFEAVQIHGKFEECVVREVHIPIWAASNLSGTELPEFIKGHYQSLNLNIRTVLLDAKEYGSGRTFGWERFDGRESESEQEKETFRLFRKKLKEQQIRFALAGGLHAGNVSAGIRLFEPDIVDVSTGVEIDGIKDYDKIMEFVRGIRQGEGHNRNRERK